jgi:hypothetical protein
MECAMPPVGELSLSWIRSSVDRMATHEDYTVAILESTALGRTIAENFDFGPRHVASLVRSDVKPGDDFFVDGGLDHRRLLGQIVSSELDVDRMDYLVRDATYTGARYGQVDTTWLLSNLTTWVANGQVNLALEGRAVYAFDHFLLARHHMFLMVYFHHKSVIYEEMLRRYVESSPSGLRLADSPDRSWRLPADLDEYLLADDVALASHLRGSDDPWARRIVQQQPYRRVYERHGDARTADISDPARRLRAEGIDVIAAESTGRLSRYAGAGSKRRTAPDIYVLERMPGEPVERVRSLTEASQVFERYADERVIARLYVPDEDRERAGALLRG